MSDRDTSGLWDQSQVGAPDRTVPIAPPPRPQRMPSGVDEGPPAVASVPPSSQEAIVTDLATVEPEASNTDSMPVLLALAFTAEQMDWIRKASIRQNKWAGEFFEELFYKHKAAVLSIGVGPRTRRRSSNYTGTRVKVSAAACADFNNAATELGASRAALGRAIVEAERSPVS